MTDITELAQREKFEAWWERTQHNGNPPRFGWECWRDGEGYKVDDDNSELDGMWEAWKAAGAELVEVLENANRYIERLREWNAGLAQESCERQQLISELEPIRAAAEKLVRCKGCYHSEQNYRSLAALFGVTTPDLPPLEHENVHYADAAEMEIAALRQRIAELESSGIASGILRCTECSFVQTKNIISISPDAIVIGNSKPEPCPNGCGSLQPVTWKALAIQLMFTTKQGVSELLEAKKRISELESRTVKLPPKVGSSNIPFAAHTWNCCLDEIEKRLAAASIKVEAE